MGHTVRYTAVELAKSAHMWVSPVRQRGVVVVVDGYRLYVGPSADQNVIATHACRRLVKLRDGVVSEQAVRREVRKHGFRYALEAPSLRKTAVQGQASRRAM